MEFWTNLVSTFIGAFSGFVFSIVLFFLTNNIGRKSAKESLENNLIKEFEFNEHYLENISSDLYKAIEKINADSKNVFIYFNYINFQRLFITQYFQQGYLYEKLTPDDIVLLDKILTHMNLYGQQYVNDSMDKWKKDQLMKKEIVDIISYERDSIEGFIKDLDIIKAKIKPKMHK